MTDGFREFIVDGKWTKFVEECYYLLILEDECQEKSKEEEGLITRGALAFRTSKPSDIQQCSRTPGPDYCNSKPSVWRIKPLSETDEFLLRRGEELSRCYLKDIGGRLIGICLRFLFNLKCRISFSKPVPTSTHKSAHISSKRFSATYWRHYPLFGAKFHSWN